VALGKVDNSVHDGVERGDQPYNSLDGSPTRLPFVVAFLTGFYTPQVGVSRRSLTFAVYAIC
jgi:hypothetical protein